MTQMMEQAVSADQGKRSEKFATTEYEMLTCSRLCCSEHLVPCPIVAEDYCPTCDEPLCLGHLGNHDCDRQKALRELDPPSQPTFITDKPEPFSTYLPDLEIPSAGQGWETTR